MATPQVTTLIDPFTRADGLLNAGGGSTNWTAGKVGSSSGGNWVVASNVAKPNAAGANHLSAFNLPGDMEVVFTTPTAGAASTFAAVYFRLVNPTLSTWEGYWFIYDLVNWKINKRVAGVTTTIGSVGVSASGHTLAAGDKVWIHRVGTALKLRHYRVSDGFWTDAPLIDVVDSSFQSSGPIALEASGAWTIDDIIGDAAVSETGPASSMTLTVDADHGSATDTQTRATVTSSNPLKTILKALQIAQATPDYADVIEIKWAANADATNGKDTSVYAGFTHNEGLGNIPLGDNSANETIIVRGVDVSGHMAKTLGLVAATDFKNWQFENLQFGYDFDSGDDNLTAQDWLRPVDLTFVDCVWTGGGAQITNASGDMTWTDCEISARWSPFKSTGGRRLDGAGFRIINSANTGEDFRCHFWWDGCEFHHIEGEDGVQVGTGAATQLGTWCKWSDCHFHDIVQAGADGSVDNPASIHTDVVQILGGPEYRFENCEFDRCTSCIQASDFHNGLIHISNCKLPRSAVTIPDKAGIAISIQGTDTLELINNTCVDNGFGLGIKLGFKQPAVTTKMTMLNNIFDGVSGSGMVFSVDTVVHGNVIVKALGNFVIPSGNKTGIVEFGTSIDTDQELAALAGHVNAAKDAGVNDALVPSTDRLGRSRDGGLPDAGCHETPAAYNVRPESRPPFLIGESPLGSGASVSSNFAVTLFPKSGEVIDPDTVDETSFFVVDPGGHILPVKAISISSPDVDNHQTITLDVDGRLYPYVSYTATLTDVVADTEGSALQLPLTWTVQAAGPIDPAVYPVPPQSWENWNVAAYARAQAALED